ncbi:MAG: enoyl-CoA hydratase-related protein [Nitrospiraceae bacterium]
MRSFASLSVESHKGIVGVTLNRPERRNAFDDRMVTELREAFEELHRDPSLRGIVLAGAGPAFCAGADVQWMHSASPVSEMQARADADHLTQMYRVIDECPCPVIGRVHGAAFGGGIGLMAVCDIVVAAEHATFSLSEAKLGLVPAVIAPFLLRKVGASFLRRYCLTGETFSTSVAHRFGLVHDVVRHDELDTSIAALIEAVLYLAPHAVRESKALIRRILELPDTDRWTVCAEANARARRSTEAEEGLRAFLEKRLPLWAKPHTQKPEQETLKPRDVAAQRT